MNFLTDMDFIDKIKAKEIALTKKGYLNFPSWLEIFNDLNKSLDKKYQVRQLDGLAFVTHNVEEHIDSCKMFIEQVKFLFPNKIASAHAYTTITKKSKGLGNHKDTVDVLFWQVHGTTLWIVEDIEFILEPGDIIFVPTGISHQVISLTPRVGISFGFE